MTTTLRRGMTLLEVMIALAVLAFGLSGAFATVGYASRFQSTAAHVEEASALAQSLLSALLAVPIAGTTVGGDGGSIAGQSLFWNTTTANDGDIADTAGNFALATLPANSYDHQDGEIGFDLGKSVIPLPSVSLSDGGTATSNGYARYWNVAPLPTDGGSGPGFTIAVIVRWSESGTWRRTVVVGTRYQP
jgi:prepilin-type N-terminal cleavage/methylation domain-containing protein